jgi:chromosome transmission fidelity protein 18
MKVADINYLAVLNNLFSPLSKKRVKELGMTDDEEGKYVSRLSREIEGSGKESNIASGKFLLLRGPIAQCLCRLLWSLRHTSSP